MHVKMESYGVGKINLFTTMISINVITFTIEKYTQIWLSQHASLRY